MSRRAGVLLVALSLAAACSSGDDDDGGSSGASGLAAQLEELPARSGDGPATVAFGDLAQAADLAGIDLAGLEIPVSDDPDDLRPLLQDIYAITGGPVGESTRSSVVAVTPDAAHGERFADIAAFAGEVGWSVLQVDRFVEYQVPPNVVTVMEGRFDEDRLTEALGEADDGVWQVGDPDGDLDLRGISPARPLGEPLWLSLVDDDRLVVTRTAEDMAGVRGGDGDSLADDDDLRDLADALDAEDVYSAILYGGPMAADLGRFSPDQVEALCRDTLPEPFAAVATGIAETRDGPVLVLAYVHGSDDAAKANAEALQAALADGASMRAQRPWSDTFSAASTETDGRVLVARLDLVDPADAGVWRQLLLERENLVSSC